MWLWLTKSLQTNLCTGVYAAAWPDDERALRWLQGKNVLRKEPMSRDVGEQDVFIYNAGFHSKFYKVKIGTVSAQRESEPEKQETRQKARAPLTPSAWPLAQGPWRV